MMKLDWLSKMISHPCSS